MDMVIGDLHGEFGVLKKMIESNPEWTSVTIAGDVGLGFPDSFDVPFESPIPIRFIRGNHDNPEFIKNLPEEFAKANWHYIPDGTIKGGILYIGGAWSIDYDRRTPGFDWWPNEEVSPEEWKRIYQALELSSSVIHTVITHEAPLDIIELMLLKSAGKAYPNLTNTELSHLMKYQLTGPHKPTRWYYGHHHYPFRAESNGIKFQCLNIAGDGSHKARLDIWEE